MMPGPIDQAQPPSATSEALGPRLALADTVVSGVVSATTQAAPPSPPFVSEHGPDWWRATVDVETVAKGQVSSKIITVLFAHSTDVAWFRSPKLKIGDRRVLLLPRTDPFGKPLAELAVVDPLDVQPIAALDRVRALLHDGPR